MTSDVARQAKIGTADARRGVWPVVTIVVVAAVACMPLYVDDSLLSAAIVILLGCYMAQCWNLAAGYAGQFSLGHTVFFGAGGYASSVLFSKFGLSPWVGALVGAAIAAVIGAALSALAFRFRVTGVFFAVVTLCSAEVARALVENWDFAGGTSGIIMILADDPANMMFFQRGPYFLIILAMVVALALATWALERSRFGQQLVALREDEPAAEAIGVPAFRHKVVIIALSAAATALAGTFYAQFLLFIVPETLFSFEHMLTMMLATMVGGAGTILGPIAGAVLFGVISDVLRSLPFTSSREAASLFRILYGLILIVIVFRLPGGLMSILPRRRDR